MDQEDVRALEEVTRAAEVIRRAVLAGVIIAAPLAAWWMLTHA